MTRAALTAAAVLLLAGCGGGQRTAPPVAKPPHIPRALAQTWIQQANAVAQALADTDGCTAINDATALRDAVTSSEAQVPRRLRATLLAAVDSLPSRITCNPAPPPAHKPPNHPKPPKPHDHGPGHGHHDH